MQCDLTIACVARVSIWGFAPVWRPYGGRRKTFAYRVLCVLENGVELRRSFSAKIGAKNCHCAGKQQKRLLRRLIGPQHILWLSQ